MLWSDQKQLHIDLVRSKVGLDSFVEEDNWHHNIYIYRHMIHVHVCTFSLQLQSHSSKSWVSQSVSVRRRYRSCGYRNSLKLQYRECDSLCTQPCLVKEDICSVLLQLTCCSCTKIYIFYRWIHNIHMEHPCTFSSSEENLTVVWPLPPPASITSASPDLLIWRWYIFSSMEPCRIR